MNRALPPLLYLGVALLLCRDALAPEAMAGRWTGEGWGRAYVTAQALRWLRGDAPFGWADLLNYPEGQPLWPIDPALQLVQIPVEAALGRGAGVGAALLLLAWLAGWGPWRLARRLGAGAGGALAAGLLVQLCPWLLRNLQEAILEAGCVGIAALAIERIHAARGGGWAAAAGAGAGALLLAASSPYYALYLALGCGLVAAFERALWPAWGRIILCCALGCALALLPLRLAEGGERGRFTAAAHGIGYQQAPSRLVLPDGSPYRRPRLHRPPQEASGLADALRMIPGGAALTAATLLGLALPAGRRWGLLGLAFWLLGPGVPATLRALGVKGLSGMGPLHHLLAHLPLTSAAGNPDRMLAAWALPAAIAAGLAARRPRAWAPLLALIALEAPLILPSLALPSSPLRAEAPVLAALAGPTVVFPSGDPPLWHPGVAPKEAHFLAGQAGVPIAADYGRGRTPADLSAQLSLARAANVPVGEIALQLEGQQKAPADVQFSSLLLLEDALEPAQLAAARSWLAASGATELARGERMSAWRLAETPTR